MANKGKGGFYFSDFIESIVKGNVTADDVASALDKMIKLQQESALSGEDEEDELLSYKYADIIANLLSLKETLEEKERLKKQRIAEEKRQKEEEKRRQKELEKQRKREEEEAKKRHIAEVTSYDLPMDFENAFGSDARASDVRADSISDGLVYSLVNLGRVDIEYIAMITGEELKTVICELKGAIYQNPETWNECFYKGWETAEEYLSGNLLKKLSAAMDASEKYDGYFEDNVEAIKKVMPPFVSNDKIYVTLGSPWVPPDIIDDFFDYLFDNRYSYHTKTVYDEKTGTWDVRNKNFFYSHIKARSTFGTSRLNATQIIENTLNMRAIAVYDTVDDPERPNKKKKKFNKTASAHAMEKQKKILEEFQNWIWRDKARRDRLEDIYAEKFACLKARMFDGSFLKFPDMNADVALYPYQKNAVARILFTPNTLLAHDVGSGKTYIMIAAAMELKRMGLSKKNLFVVPNNIVGQWRGFFELMYPDANILTVEPKSFKPEKRRKVLEQIRDNDYDGIIMAYSCFELIPLSRDYYIDSLQKEAGELAESVLKNPDLKPILSKKQKKLGEEIAKILGEAVFDADAPYFDTLGISRLFVDEAHNFKNVPIDTKTSGVLGISSQGSVKCRHMLEKVRFIQRTNGGGGVVMATGTPITNSITDVFVMQNYLQSGELSLLDLNSFDSWIGMFAERETSFEIDVDANGYRLATRFSRFHNIPELTALLSSIADFHSVRSGGILPEFKGYTDALIVKTYELMKYLKQISERADAIRNGNKNRREDNMLKITTDGRKVALDMRLIDSKAKFSFQSKVARCAENVADIYLKTDRDKSAQVIFCDTSTPKVGFNMYDEMKRLLVNMGISADEIAFVHDAVSETAKTKLFKAVNDGRVRVLMGSTFKLGIGVNVQERLIALHHLDIPWRPADMVQREGRILRQGNKNPEVFIYRYVTEGSFDAYSWQLLESKQRFISALLSGVAAERSREDIDDCVLSYAEVKALAVGNPLVKKRVEAANELSRYISLQRKAAEERERLSRELIETKATVTDMELRIERAEKDITYLAEDCTEYTKEQRVELRSLIFSELEANILKSKERPIATYRGFDIVLPANMRAEKKYVWLRHEGRYYVEMAESERGVMLRMDNLLEKLPELMQRFKDRLTECNDRIADINEELNKNENYTTQIEYCKKMLKKIDDELGVDNG